MKKNCVVLQYQNCSFYCSFLQYYCSICAVNAVFSTRKNCTLQKYCTNTALYCRMQYFGHENTAYCRKNCSFPAKNCSFFHKVGEHIWLFTLYCKVVCMGSGKYKVATVYQHQAALISVDMSHII